MADPDRILLSPCVQSHLWIRAFFSVLCLPGSSPALLRFVSVALDSLNFFSRFLTPVQNPPQTPNPFLRTFCPFEFVPYIAVLTLSVDSLE